MQDDQIQLFCQSFFSCLRVMMCVGWMDGWMVVARYIYRRNHHNNMYAKYELYNLSLDKLAFRKNALRCENFVCCCCWCCFSFSGCYYMIRKGRSVPAKLSRCHQCRSVGRCVCWQGYISGRRRRRGGRCGRRGRSSSTPQDDVTILLCVRPLSHYPG